MNKQAKPSGDRNGSRETGGHAAAKDFLSRWSPELWVALFYAAFASLWFLGVEPLLLQLIRLRPELERFHSLKDWGFVAATATGFYWVLRTRRVRREREAVTHQQAEAERLALGQRVEHLLNSAKVREREIQRLNRFYATLSQVNQSIVRIQSRDELFREVCRIAVEHAGFKLAWIGWRDLETQRVQPLARAGERAAYLDNIHVYADDRVEGLGPVGTSIRENQPSIFNDFISDARTTPWRDAAAASGFGSVASLPIRINGVAGGALAVYAGEPDVFQEKEMALLEEMAMDISFALDRFEQDARRRSAEAALGEEVIRRRILTDQSNDGIMILDENGKVCETNPRFATMLGYSVAELSQLHVWDWDARWTREQLLELIRNLGEAGTRFETRHRRKDGTIYDVEISANSVWLGGKKLAFSLSRDITERKRTETQLRQLSQAVEQSPASIVITNTAGAIEYVNPKFTELTGYTLDEVRGRNPRLLKSGELAAEEYQRLWRTIKAGGEWRGEFHNRKKNGELFWELARISPILDDTGRIAHYMAVKEDITERRRLETQIRQAQKMEAVGQLAGGVAHDFNNILAATMLQLNLLQTNPGLDAETRLALGELEAGTKRAASLTRQLLTFSRRSVMQVETLDLNLVVENLLRMLRRVIGEHIELQWKGKAALAAVAGDAGMLEQVIVNLVVNARDAMAEGGRLTIATDEVRFDAQALPAELDARPGHFVRLSVTDTGCGMNEVVLKRIFEPFFTTKPPGKGTGLGLATVYGITSQHKGWVGVESCVGAGSTFRVYLPAKEFETVSAPVAQTGTVVRGGDETILLVEDDVAVRQAARSYLQRCGYSVLEAATGPDALRCWLEHPDAVQLLFTDMVIPGGMSGLQLAARLRVARPDLKVILTSGYSADLLRQNDLNAQRITFVPKPCPPFELAGTIRRCLDQPAA